MTLLSPRLAGYALVMLAMLAAGLSTGTRLYYLVFYALLAMLLLALNVVQMVWQVGLYQDRKAAEGYTAHAGDENVIARAYAIRTLFVGHEKHIYGNDRFAGSMRGMYADVVKKASFDIKEQAKKMQDFYITGKS